MNAQPLDQKSQSHSVENLRVVGVTRLITPAQIKEQLPAGDRQLALVERTRREAKSILRGEDDRMLVIVGPCSIHDPVSALEYARQLAVLSQELADRYLIVMRVYFEKPRTTIGWKGFINDPNLDESCDMAKGILLARKLLLDILDLGLPTATEFLDPIIPQYTAELITWAAIGARTTESQTHREMASGLSMPVGFKNATDGSFQTAIDAMASACTQHSFLGIDQDGATSIIKTAGNPDSHVVLRGGRTGPNYHPEDVDLAEQALRKTGLHPTLMVDCSHANSGKDPNRQPDVWKSILAQRRAGNRHLIGAMLESHLHFGSQPLTQDPSILKYGVSITDACMDWETTAALLKA
ncbi:MAG: 3-deoxy-7-phosphoheptulonate synthase [Spartobacteria bacterium AMD-G5]|nr:MAG: 3-deoxy-7-phosphoheptulonate synthase [Spartobacteria bacterium AMD-G5]